jgi:carbon monoxide dehydrogenase subunit G
MNLPPSFPVARVQAGWPDRYSAQVIIGVAGIRGTYDAHIEMRDKQEPNSVRLVGTASGALGFGAGSGLVTLRAEPDGRTPAEYQYEADVGGKLAAVGQRMLGTVTRYVIGRFSRRWSGVSHRSAPRAGADGWRGCPAAAVAEIRHEARRLRLSSAGNGIGSRRAAVGAR